VFFSAASTAQKGNTGFKRKVLKLYDLDEVSMVQSTNRDEALSALRY
jgi:Holliday junction DNA helicase RuvA